MSDLNLNNARKYIYKTYNLFYIQRSQLLCKIVYVITYFVIGNGIGFLHLSSTKQWPFNFLFLQYKCFIGYRNTNLLILIWYYKSIIPYVNFCIVVLHNSSIFNKVLRISGNIFIFRYSLSTIHNHCYVTKSQACYINLQ